MSYWLSNAQFLHVADELARDRVVFLTGAGISYGMPGATSKSLPSWRDLMLSLQDEARARGCLTRRDEVDIDMLLDESRAAPTSSHFLEVASILADAVGSDFAQLIADKTRPMLGATSPAHLAIAGCKPRAIITYNYDLGHEAAFEKLLSSGDPAWETILAADPDLLRSEQQIRAALAKDGMRRRLIKGHGSIDVPASLVLTRASYREVLARRPAYRALLTQIFVNYTVVAVGFGMDDPDFQDTLDMLERDVGGALGRHVFFSAKPAKPKSGDPSALVAYEARCAEQERRDLLMRRRYGFEVLECADYNDVAAILEALQVTAGPELQAIVDMAGNRDREARSKAHEMLGNLSESGASRAVNLIERHLVVATDDWLISEWCYALGRVRPKVPRAKELLREVINTASGLRSVAIAVISFVEYADETDIAWLRSRLARWEASTHPAEGTAMDPSSRVRDYLRYAIQKTEAKHAPWNQTGAAP